MYLLLPIVNLISQNTRALGLFQIIVVALTLANSALNPLIYAFSSVTYRCGMKKILYPWLWKKKDNLSDNITNNIDNN